MGRLLQKTLSMEGQLPWVAFARLVGDGSVRVRDQRAYAPAGQEDLLRQGTGSWWGGSPSGHGVQQNTGSELEALGQVRHEVHTGGEGGVSAGGSMTEGGVSGSGSVMEDSMRLGANGSREACSDVAVVVGIDRRTKVGNPFWARTPDERRRACAAFDGLLKVTVGLGTDGVFDAPEGAGERGRDREVMERLARQHGATLVPHRAPPSLRSVYRWLQHAAGIKGGLHLACHCGDELDTPGEGAFACHGLSLRGAVYWLRSRPAGSRPRRGRHLVPSAGNWPLSDIFRRFNHDVAQELAGFTWPITTLDEFRRLLACRHASPHTLVGFEFTGAVRDAHERAHGGVAVSVDRRDPLTLGPHATLDVLEVLDLACWRDAYLFPPSAHQVRSNPRALEAKQLDGRTFWGIAAFIRCWCVCAERVIVGQPDTVIPDFYLHPSQKLRRGDTGWQVNLYVRGRLPIAEQAEVASGLCESKGAEKLHRWRDAWAKSPPLAQAMVLAAPTGEAPAALSYVNEIELFAAAWFDAGLPVPSNYRVASARPPDPDVRAYQAVRGRGHGTRLPGATPVSRQGVSAHAHDQLAAAAAQLIICASALTSTCFVLMMVSLQAEPLVFAHANGFDILGAQLDLSAVHRLAMVHRWADSMLAGSSAVTFLAGRFDGGRGAAVYTTPTAFTPPASHCVHTPAERRKALSSGATFLWLTLSALGDAPSARVASHAVWAATALRSPMLDAPGIGIPGGSDTFRFGVTAIASLVDRPVGLPTAPTAMAAALLRGIREGAMLRDALLSETGDNADDLAAWAERIRPPELQDVPEGLLERLPSFTDPRFDGLSFSPIPEPPHTRWMPRMPEQQAPPAGRCPRRAADLMPERVWARVQRWLHRTLEDLICVRDHGDACIRSRPSALVIGQNDLYPWARGLVWDFRGGGCGRPLRFDRPLEHTLNVPYLLQRLRDYPNQRLLSFIAEGVRYQADVELQTVLVPHLMSLSSGFDSVQKELRRMSAPGLRWYTHHADFPFWPMYSLGEGAVPRKLENRWRRCEEGGGPRKETFDSAGVRAWSINEASRNYHMPQHFLLDSRPEMLQYLGERGLPATVEQEARRKLNRNTKWERQRMPSLAMVARDLVVLKRAGMLMSEPVYVFGDDAKDYFNHLVNAPEEEYKINTIFLDAGDLLEEAVHVQDKGSITFISQRRMGFGLHPNSIIAQEWSEALNSMLREDVDAVEDPLLEADPRPSVQAWLTERRKLQSRVGGHQRRLYSVFMYCDDNIIIVVGVHRAIRLLRAWRSLTGRVGLIMAIPEKRSLGVWGVWVGALVFAGLGIIVIPRQKILRCSEAITRLLRHGIEFEHYRSLVGLLEHVRCVAVLPRRYMHGLYAPHGADGEGRGGPQAMVRCTQFMEAQLIKWLDVLSCRCGCAVTDVLKMADLARERVLLFVTSSDAATDSEPPGMGGFMNGYWWHFPIPEEALDWLHITSLELLARGFDSIIMDAVVPPRARMLARTDATTTFATLARESEHSEALMDAHHCLLSSAVFRRAAERTDLGAVAGDGNLAADAASRSYLDVLQSLAKQLRIHLIRLPFPHECQRIFYEVLELARRRGRRVNRNARRPPPPPMPTAAVSLLDAMTPPRDIKRQRRAFLGFEHDSTLGYPGEGPPSLLTELRSGLLAAGRPAIGGPHEVSRPAGRSLLDELRKEREPPTADVPGKHARHQVLDGKATRAKPYTHQPLPGQSMQVRMVGGVRLAAPAYVRGNSNSARSNDIREAAARRAPAVAGRDASASQVASVEAGLAHAATMAALGASVRTLSKDDHAWDMWRSFSTVYGWDPIVSRESAVHAPDALASRLGLFVLWVYPQIEGRLTKDAKPSSVFNNYPGAISRILKRDFKLPVPPQKAFEAEAKGLLRSYQKVYGTIALAKRKRMPITPAMWQRVEGLQPGTALANRAPWMSPSTAHDDRNVLRLGKVLQKTAHRLGEIVMYHADEITYLTYANVTAEIGGVVRVDPTEEQLRSMRPGDRFFIAPCASKPDQFGEEHCHFPSVIELSGTPGSAGAAIRDILLERPCHGDARRTMPLFATADGRPYTYSTLNRLLHQLMAALFGEGIASTLSWHSFRIWLAIALREAGCPDEIVQLICRWQCRESLQAYAQIGIQRNLHWTNRAEKVQVQVMRTGALPALDNEDALARLNDDVLVQRRTAQQRPGPTATATGQAAPQAIGPPLLAPRDRVEVRWGDEFFPAVFTSSRIGISSNGRPARLHRLWYDATGGWPAQGHWHDLDKEEWRRI